jgi:hypothetical protein
MIEDVFYRLPRRIASAFSVRAAGFSALEAERQIARPGAGG